MTSVSRGLVGLNFPITLPVCNWSVARYRACMACVALFHVGTDRLLIYEPSIKGVKICTALMVALRSSEFTGSSSWPNCTQYGAWGHGCNEGFRLRAKCSSYWYWRGMPLCRLVLIAKIPVTSVLKSI